MITPLPEVNELALRLAARVLRRDVDGGAARTLWRCIPCSHRMVTLGARPGACLRCGVVDFTREGFVLPLPPAPSPEDELKALARDIEAFVDLVVARLGSVRWELERAEKQLRVQDGEIEELQSKLAGAKRAQAFAEGVVNGATARGSAEMRERAAGVLKHAAELADAAGSDLEARRCRALEERIRALPLAPARYEDDTTPETPAARATAQGGEVVALYRCRRDDAKWGVCALKDAPTLERHCGCCGHETTPDGRVRLVAIDVPVGAAPLDDARARQANAGARAVAKLGSLSDEHDLAIGPAVQQSIEASAGARAVVAMEGIPTMYVCSKQGCPRCALPTESHAPCGGCGSPRVPLPPPAPENLPEARAARYECKNIGCDAYGIADFADPRACPRCGNKLSPRS